jgi:hypothetical protein
VRRISRRVVVGVAAAALLTLWGVLAHATTPRTEGLEPQWATDALEGEVVGLALLSGDHTAVDLVTGKRITLGSATGGTPYVGNGILIITRGTRVDAATLDAKTRWSWTAPAGTTPTPLAARNGTTILGICPTATDPDGGCALVGLDTQGKQAWRIEANGPVTPPAGRALPAVLASPVAGGGVLVTDPVSGRQTLQPGKVAATAPDGTVVLTAEQGGKCVLSRFTGPDPERTQVLDRCPADPVASDVRVVTTRHTTPLNPLRWGRTTTVLRLELTTGKELGQVAGTGRLEPLLLTPEAVVVRTGDEIVRHAIPRR